MDFHILGTVRYSAMRVILAALVVVWAFGCATQPAPVTHEPLKAVDTTPPGVPYVQYTFYWGEGGSTKVEYTVRERQP